MKPDRFLIAQIGRTIGLHGDLKLKLHTDFPEQFRAGAVLASDRGDLKIAAVDHRRGIIRFVGYASMEDAKPLTNTKLYTTREQTRAQIHLDAGEHFWFDIIGCSVVENGTTLGSVTAIDRILDTDYLDIATAPDLVASGLPRTFLLPYIPRYIVRAYPEAHRIETVDARGVLEAS